MTAIQSFPEAPSSEPKLLWGVFCSSILHFVLICVLVGVPEFSSSQKTYFSSTYRVKLVDVSTSRPSEVKVSKEGRSTGGKVVVRKTIEGKSEKTERGKRTKEKKGSSLVVKDKMGKSGAEQGLKSKLKTRDAEKEFSLALSKIKEKVEEKRRKEEIARIQDKIAEQEGETEGEGSEPTAGSWGIPSGQGVVADLPLNYRLYYDAIEQKIKNNWNLALPRGVIEDMRGMEVVLSITIRSDGEIVKTSFEKKSGNVYLDESAFRAVKKSSPLPPFSQYNIREPSFETGIIFPAGELL